MKTAGGIRWGKWEAGNGKEVFFTLDVPARILVLYVKERSGYNSCPKCEVVVEYAKKESSSGRVFFYNDARLRTTRSLLQRSDKEYHKGVSTVVTRLSDNPVIDVVLYVSEIQVCY